MEFESSPKDNNESLNDTETRIKTARQAIQQLESQLESQLERLSVAESQETNPFYSEEQKNNAVEQFKKIIEDTKNQLETEKTALNDLETKKTV